LRKYKAISLSVGSKIVNDDLIRRHLACGDGTLNVTRIDGFVPALGDTLDLFDSTTLAGPGVHNFQSSRTGTDLRRFHRRTKAVARGDPCAGRTGRASSPAPYRKICPMRTA